MFSTANIPVSTNYILAAIQNGIIQATDTLRNISTVGGGYLPELFSTLNGEIISVHKEVLSTGVTSTMFANTYNTLSSQIVELESTFNATSSYITNICWPSTSAGLVTEISTLGAYIAQTGGVTSSQMNTMESTFISTYIPLQLNNFSVASYNYLNKSIQNVPNTYETVADYITFSTMQTSTISTIDGTYVYTSSLFTPFVSTLSSYNKANISTYTDFGYKVSTLNTVTGVDPYAVIGLVSSTASVPFGSNIEVRTINAIGNSNIGISQDISPGFFLISMDISGSLHIMSSITLDVPGNTGVTKLTDYSYKIMSDSVSTNATTLSVSASQPYYKAVSKSDDQSFAPQINIYQPNYSMSQLLVGKTSNANYPASNQFLTLIGPTNNNLAISMNSNGNVGIRKPVTNDTYSLDISGSLYLSGDIYKNNVFVDFNPTETAVLGILASTSVVSFGSNINVSSIITSNGNVGINNINPTFQFDVIGDTNIANNMNIIGEINIVNSIDTIKGTTVVRNASNNSYMMVMTQSTTYNTVSINYSNTNSFYILDVSGNIHTSNTIIQNKPYVWSYTRVGKYGSNEISNNFVPFSGSNYEAIITPITTMTSYTIPNTTGDRLPGSAVKTYNSPFSAFVIPYTGTYSFDIMCTQRIDDGQSSSLYLYNLTKSTVMFRSLGYTPSDNSFVEIAGHINFISSFTKNERLAVFHIGYNNEETNCIFNILMNVEYFG